MDTPPMPNDFNIISTIRSDEILLHSYENTWVNPTISGTSTKSPVQFYMLGYHRDRLLASAEAFGWDTSPLEGPEAFQKLLGVLHDHLERKHNDRSYAAPLKA